MHDEKQRSGMTLIEVLTVFAIIGILTSLISTAVVSARESARSLQCSHNLKQIGVAIASYESQHDLLPPGTIHKYALLPQLDAAVLFNHVRLPADSPVEAWGEIADKPLDLFICPSDPAPKILEFGPETPATYPRRIGATNYLSCYGSGALRFGFNGLFGPVEDLYSPARPAPGQVRLAQARRGLSQTAAMSEAFHSGGQPTRLQTTWGIPAALVDPQDFDALTDFCPRLPPQPSAYGWANDGSGRGLPWYAGEWGAVSYNHALTPNQPSCTSSPGIPAFGLYTASSFQPSFVSVLWGDGHVAHVSQAIDLHVWRGAGQRVESALVP
ncbi:MAG: hypothetical protein B7Z55_07610 [Planctomycetales bacterium 12-60-4]|nr:MAG: hypothetical protein B7Z55_07610 [Planctomycetales bacterium 12-60-4]